MSLILDYLFPSTCYSCGAQGAYLCPNCLRSLKVNPLNTTSSIRPLSGIVSIFPYHSAVKNIIHGLKYEYVTDLVVELSKIAVNTIEKSYPHLLSYWQQKHFLFVPIPLHPYRQNQRGFNQSDLLGKNIASQLGLVYLPELLFRTINTPSQAKLNSQSDRISNLSQAFSLNPIYLHHQFDRIILFDDVVTTASTLTSAAKSLDSINYREIWGLSIAGSDPA